MIRGSEISFTNEVLTEVSKRLKMEPKEVKKVYNSLISYLRYLVYETDCTSIFLKHIGTLYFPYREVMRRLKRTVISDKYKELLEKKANKIYNHAGSLEYVSKSRHLMKPKLKNKHYSNGKSLEEIEYIQNEKNKE